MKPKSNRELISLARSQSAALREVMTSVRDLWTAVRNDEYLREEVGMTLGSLESAIEGLDGVVIELKEASK